jgi:ATP-dependent helicase HrpB
LSLEEQQKALLPSKGIKVILSTNLAETSLTVPGATAVIDVGLNRQARVSPWSGLDRLVTVPASQASAAQRAGRAGRLGPGTCLRLFTQFDFEHRAAFDLPEISRSDLAKSLLDLKGLFPGSLEAFPWFLPPPTPALDSAQTLLRDLGALDASGVLTTLGRHMAKLPLTVRLARFLLAVQELAPKESPALSWACRLAALLQTEESISVDFLEELRTPPRSYETQHLEEQLAGNLRVPPAPKGAPHHEIINHMSRGLLLAFPDRVAKIRESAGSKSRDKRGNQRELVMAQGGSVTAPDGALTRSHDLFLVVEAQESGDRGQARALSLCPIEEDWLLDFFPGNLREEKALEWNSTAQRMEGSNRLCYRQLVLEEKPLAPGEFGKEGKEFLYREALAAGPAAYADPEELTAFLNRLRFIGERAAKNMIPEKELIEETLRNLCEGRRSFADLKSAGLVEALRGGLPPQSLELLEKLAPASVPLASGRRMAVHYEEGKPPWGESRIQDFFGLREGPKVGGGEVAVILHLLSPAKRAVQITSDLAGFWERHYPALRKEFSRRYPRHKWPENPLA